MRWMWAVLLVCWLSACGGSRGLYEDEVGGRKVDEARVQRLIADLAGAEKPDDFAALAVYDQAVQQLTLEGAPIEPMLIEALVGNDSWGVRLGAIHVLDSVGSKACVPALIGALGDEQPLVARKAVATLRVLTNHDEIPAAGQPVAENGLPPVPEPAPEDLRRDAQAQLWAEWHVRYRDTLRKAWQTWWEANRHLVRIE